MPPRFMALPRKTAETAPAQWDHHLQSIAQHGRVTSQKDFRHMKRARAEAAICRCKQVIGDGLRSRADEGRATEVHVAVHALNRMLAFGHRISVHIA